ncbi:MAG: hypothetical protein Q9162_007397 [Coniocarpon cinnabarinum]
MASFKAAVAANAHALETDVHLSKDGVVMLSHDGDLKRCFGIDKKIIDLTADEIKLYRTTDRQEQMPTLKEVLELLNDPSNQKMWLMLDIKLENDADDIMRLMAKTVEEAKYVPLCEKYFSGFPVCNIGFSVAYSQQFLATPEVAFSMLIASLLGPFGQWLIYRAKKNKRRLYSWTVNHQKTMDWCIRRELDGVITDDPEKYLSECRSFREHEVPSWPWKLLIMMTQINVFATIFTAIFWQKHGLGLQVSSANKKRI